MRAAGLLAVMLPGGACLALYGQLGSGKTVFARGLIHGAGVAETVPVTSPTFVIVSEYTGKRMIHHVDAYRLAGAANIVDLGSRELFFSDALSIVEWAERIEAALPEERINVRLAVTGETSRRIEIEGIGAEYVEIVSRLGQSLAPSG